MLAHHIKRGSCLDEVTMCKFLKDHFIVLRVVAGDVPNLKNHRLVVQLTSASAYLGHDVEVVAHLIKCPQDTPHCEPYSFEQSQAGLAQSSTPQAHTL